MWILYNIEILRAFRFKSSYTFLTYLNQHALYTAEYNISYLHLNKKKITDILFTV